MIWNKCRAKRALLSNPHCVSVRPLKTSAQDQAFSPIALMRLARVMKPMELDTRDEAILQGDVVLQAYFVIKGRIEAYVDEDSGRQGSRGSWLGGDDAAHPLRQSSYLGVWGPGSLWGLSNIMLGGASEVRVLGALSGTDLGVRGCNPIVGRHGYLIRV